MSKTKKTSKKSAKPEIPTGFEDVLTYVCVQSENCEVCTLNDIIGMDSGIDRDFFTLRLVQLLNIALDDDETYRRIQDEALEIDEALAAQDHGDLRRA